MKLLVLDGNSILNRAFYGVKLLSTKNGFYTNAIYGFLNILSKLKEETTPDAVAIAFDMKSPTFRHKCYDGYKAKRKGMPEELYMQFPVLKELLSHLGYKLVEKEGFEADDILGTLAQSCTNSGNTCIIATGDKDSLQLVNKNVSVRITSTKFGKAEVVLYDEEKIYETYGIQPQQLIDVKALQGDASDNIPGVPGIGQKGALELIQKFGSIDYIYDNIETLDIKPGVKRKLIEGKDSAQLSRYLGTIVKDIPIDTNISNYIIGEGEHAKASKLLSELEMFSMIKKLNLPDCPHEDDNVVVDKPVKVINNFDLDALREKLTEGGTAVFFANFNSEEITELAFYLNDEVYVVGQSQKNFFNFVKSIFEDQTIIKVTYNIKSLFYLCNKLNVDMRNVDFDVILAAYLLNSSSKNYDIEKLVSEYSIPAQHIDASEHLDLIKNVISTYHLFLTLSEKISQRNEEKLLKEIEIPFAKVLASMEYEGFCVNRTALEEFAAKLTVDIEKLESKIKTTLGNDVNINSPKQLGIALFEDLSLPVRKKTKNGYSTSAEVLESLRYTHPVIEEILQYRTLTKLKSTYCDGLAKAISDDGKIHSTFNQTETKTGRISSTEPNLQNIPVKTELGKEFRKFFIAKEGYLLVDADYSQIELRILAHLSNDQNMIYAFKNDVDIHKVTASQVFNVPIDMVTPLMRSRAKAVNFGIIYGISAFSLAKDIGVSRKEADSYIKNYFKHYSNIEKYMQETINFAKKTGFAETMFGRRRYLPELKSSNFNLRSFGERVARNMPIQGSAADIIKIAMINVDKKIREEKLDAKIILQVHDEIIVEALQNQAERVKYILESEMAHAVNISLPLIAEASVGKSWYDAKG